MKKFDNYVDLTAEFAEPSTIRRSHCGRGYGRAELFGGLNQEQQLCIQFFAEL